MSIADRFLGWLGFGEKRSGVDWFGSGDDDPRSTSAATHLGPVLATYRHLYDYVSTLPADFYRIDGPNREKVAPPELIRNIDDEIGLGTWLGQAIYGIASEGNAVGRVAGLTGYGLPQMIRWSGDWQGGEDTDWWLNGKPLPDSLVAHIPWIVPPGKRLGISPIEIAYPIVKAGLSAQEYADVKRGGGIPPTVLKNTAKTLTADEAGVMKSRAAESFSQGKPFVIGSDWDLSMPTIPPNHAQFIETFKLSANQIAAIYGIDPREIGGTADNNLEYSTDESRALSRAQNARPYVTRLETAVSRWLPSNIQMKLNMDATVRADIKTRTEVVGLQLADGRLSVNEARALEDREPVPGGDFYNVPVPKTEPVTRGES